jgi:protocatechuate 3,4-dioxygenase beta subunit
MASITRRRFVLTSAGLLAVYTVPTLGALRPLTPRQTAGPFYPRELPLDNDNNLVQVAGHQAPAGGEITDLHGQLLDRNGRPLGGVRVEIWQCDVNGRYHHPGDRGGRPIDPGFQGFGHTVTDSEGRYRFRTIRPVPYPGRTPHIHVAVFPEGSEPFITQLYIAGEPRNADDFLYRAIPEEQRRLVTADYRPAQAEGVQWTVEKDIVLEVTAA